MTTDTRDEEPLAWCPGCGDRIPTEVIRERGVCSNCYGTSDDPWAAGRAETTTATTEDTARAIHRALAPRWMSVAQALGPDQDAYEAMLADIAKALADAGLLATARTRPTREQIAEHLRKRANDDEDHADRLYTFSAEEWDRWYDEHLTVSHQIDGKSLRIEGRPEAIADAVLALLADQPDPADVWDEAVEKIREQHPACEDPCEMCTEMDDWLTALADNPYRGGAR